MTIAMLLLAWASPGFAALPISPRAKSPARIPASFRFMIDADTCLAPEQGSFAPDGFHAYSILVRDLLLSDTGNQTVLQVVVQPSFSSPYSLRLEQPAPTHGDGKAPRSYSVRLIRAKGHPWAQMMEEMQRQQGAEIRLGDAEQKRALPAVSKATEVKTVPIAAGLADRLAAVWAGALARTQYVNEVTVAPDGSGIGVIKTDGTTYDFWHDGRSGTTHSPEKGSLLGDLVRVVETMTHFADASHAARPALQKRLDAELDGLQQRLKRNEPCLRPSVPGARNRDQ